MPDLAIDSEFEALCPPLNEGAREALEHDILEHGIRDALVVWQGLILDGHHRFQIAEKHGLTFEITELKVNGRDEAKEWVICNQFGRRNLGRYQRCLLALQLKPLWAARAQEKQEATQFGAPQAGTTADPIKTDRKLATLAGVGHGTIHRVASIEEHAPEHIKRLAQMGQWSINRAYSFVTVMRASTPGVRMVIDHYRITDPDTVPLLARMEANEEKSGVEGTWSEVKASGFIQPGDEEEAVAISAPAGDLAAALNRKARTHRLLAWYDRVFNTLSEAEAHVEGGTGTHLIAKNDRGEIVVFPIDVGEGWQPLVIFAGGKRYLCNSR